MYGNKVVKFMKKNPEVLMDLISDQNKKKLRPNEFHKYNDESPYAGANTVSVALPSHYTKSNPKSIKSGKNSDINSNTYFSISDKPVNRIFR